MPPLLFNDLGGHFVDLLFSSVKEASSLIDDFTISLNFQRPHTLERDSRSQNGNSKSSESLSPIIKRRH
jgi:hypothetical protein